MTEWTAGPAGDRPPRVVALGGGHGLQATLAALRRITPDVTAVVTVADDGGSSGRLRRELGLLPPGDLRKALAALAGDGAEGGLWTRVSEHRFGGTGALCETSMSPRSSEISSEFVTSPKRTSLLRVDVIRTGPVTFDPLKSPMLIRTSPGTFSALNSLYGLTNRTGLDKLCSSNCDTRNSNNWQSCNTNLLQKVI